MTTTRLTSIAVMALCAAPAAAQAVTATIRAATPLTVTTNSPTTNTQTLPVGALPPAGVLASTQIGGTARTEWRTVSSTTDSYAIWYHELTGSASAGQHEVIVEWTATSPVAVDLELVHVFSGSVGTIVPTLAVDIGNNNFFEVFNGSSFTSTFANVTLGSQPFAVRIRFAGTSQLTSSFQVRAVPRNHLEVVPFPVGCVVNTMTVLPSFENTGVVALGVSPPINTPSVLVLGLAPQPTVLPPLFGVPCVVMPRGDVFLPFFTTLQIQLAIPAGVRPVDVWLQRAGILNGQVFTAEAFRVRAF